MRRNLRKLNVMLVDDKPYFRKGFRDMLLSQFDSGNIELTEASDGKEFLDKMETNPAQLVFIDIEMPVMNGIDATRQASQLYPDVPIYGLSSFDDDTYIQSMAYAGAAGFISKNEDIKHRLQMIIDNEIKELGYHAKSDRNLDELLKKALNGCTKYIGQASCNFHEIFKHPNNMNIYWFKRFSRIEKINLLVQHKKCVSKCTLAKKYSFEQQ